MGVPLPHNSSGRSKRLAQLGQWLVPICFASASAALLLFQVGYGLEVGDQLQYLLLPYREIYPDFLPGDWFTWQTSHYHQTFSWIVHGLARAFGVAQLPYSIFVLYVLNLALFGYSVLRLSSALAFGLFEACFAMVGFAMVRQLGLAGAVISHGALVPADLALPPFLLACAAYARGSTLAMGAYLGIAGFMHANYAVLGPVVLFGPALMDCRQRRALMQLLRAGLLYLAIAAPTLRVVLGSFLLRDDAPGAVAVTLFTRSPHHYDLSALRPDEFYYAFALGLLALPRALGRVGPEQTRGSYLRLSGSLLLLIAVGALGAALHVLAFSRVFTFRMSIPLFALWLLAAGRALRDFALARRPWALVWAVALCGVLTTFAQTDPLEHSPWTRLPAPAAYGGALLLLSSVLVLSPWRRLSTLARSLGAGAGLGALALALSVTHSRYWEGEAFRPPRGLHALDARVTIQPRVRALYQQIRARTPHDARFLIPPGQSQFRMHARRAIFVDWKCAPMRGDEALEWKRRMLLAMGLSDFPARGYALPRAADRAYFSRPLRDLAKLARSEHLTHVLTLRGRRVGADIGMRHLFDSGHYAVYELAR